MLEYWMQNGEAAFAAKLGRTKVDAIDKKQAMRLIKPLFQPNGKLTSFSYKMFGQLNARNREDVAGKIARKLHGLKEREGRTCSFCGKSAGAKLKGWMYPFIITKEKFPNLYPSGQVETLNTCKACAWKSIAAYSNAIFQTKRVGEESYTSVNLFFADTSEQLQAYLRTLQDALVTDYFQNVSRKVNYDVTYYPHEFLFSLIYYLSNQIREQEEFSERRIGALVLGYKMHGGSRKVIYDTVQVIQNLTPIIRALRTFNDSPTMKKAKAKGVDPLVLLFRSQRGGLRGVRLGPHVFIERERFLRSLLAEGRIDWLSLEQMIFTRLGEDRSLPFLNDFLLAMMKELGMNEKELYEQVSGEGYHLARNLLAGDTVHSAKAKAYELRRARRMEEFLGKLNLLQLDTESRLDDRPFRENESMFQKLKVFFLIGFCNGLFSGRHEKKVEA